jgi:PAS domain S-box-containing protein
MNNPEYNNFHRRLQRLRERRDWLIRTLEQTADTVMITDREGVIEFVNEAFQETTGYSAEEVLGRTPRLLKSDKHNKQFFKELWTTLLAGKPFRGVIINRKKSGQLYSSAQTICSMKDKNGEITHFIDIMRNITELRRQQQHELSLQTAHEVQERLNTTVASWPGFDIAGSVWPAMLTGGDYFDFIAQPDGCRCVAIGDDLTGIFCTSGSEREFTLEGSWYADQEIQAGADRDAAAAG